MRSSTLARQVDQYPDLESNQDLDLRRVQCDPLHHRDIRADDWICTSINRFTGPAPFSIEPRRHVAYKHEREDSNPVWRLWRPLALPGAHSCEAQELSLPSLIDNHFSSDTFQYASLTNFDQLSIRTVWRAYIGFHNGRTGA